MTVCTLHVTTVIHVCECECVRACVCTAVLLFHAMLQASCQVFAFSSMFGSKSQVTSIGCAKME